MKSNFVLIDDLEALRTKLQGAEAPLDRYWQNFLALAERIPIGEQQALPMFAWLVTGDKKYETIIRGIYLTLLKELPLADCSKEAQFHAYPAGSPVARFAIYLDWIWESGILSEEELQQLAGGMQDLVFSHCYLRLKGRLPSSDNQQASMAFACIVTGYIFGIKRGCSATAQQMYQEGLSRYYGLLKRLWPGGWSGEGSTYQIQVVAPVMALFTAFVEWTTGRDYFEEHLGGSTVREVLEISQRAIGPTGLTPGWDDYGPGEPALKTHLSYLARKTGRAEPIALIERHGMWSESIILAWYNDDKVFTLLFWPERNALLKPAKPQRSWVTPDVAGRLVSSDTTVDVFQMWDVIGGGRPGRAHINPNTIEISAFGSLHTCDSHAIRNDSTFYPFEPTRVFNEEDFSAFASALLFWRTQGGVTEPLPDDELKREVHSSAANAVLGSSSSMLAAHSCVIPDREGYRFLREEYTGKGTGPVNLPSLKGMRGDVSGFYQQLWGIERMSRTSLLLGESLLYVEDNFSAPAGHHYRWQLMLRPEVSVDGCRARQRLREGGILQIATESHHQFLVDRVDGHMRELEQQTSCLAFETYLEAGTHHFSTVMRLAAGRETVVDASSCWAVSSGGQEIPGELFDLTADCDLRGEYLGAPRPDTTVWFGRILDLSPAEVLRIERIAIGRSQGERLEVFVNGIRASEAYVNPSLEPAISNRHKCISPWWERQFVLKGLLKPGLNQVAIASSEFRGKVISGPIRLFAFLPESDSPLAVRVEGAAHHLTDGGSTWSVIADNVAHHSLTLPEGIATNAEIIAVASELGIIACGQMTEYKGPGVTLTATRPVDMEINGEGIHLDLGGQGETTVHLTSGTEVLTIQCSGFVRCRGNTLIPLRLRTGQQGPVFLNEICLAQMDDGEEFIPVVHPVTHTNSPRGVSAYEAGFPFSEGSGVDLENKLRAALHAENWRTRVSAVEYMGNHGCTWSIQELIRLFEEEEKEDLYPAIQENWGFAKMLISQGGPARTDLPEAGRRRFRLKAVILEALGRLGAREGAAVIIRTLKKKTDFYPALVMACLAAGRAGVTEAVPLLEEMSDHFEINTSRAARLALRLLLGDIDRNEFEKELLP